MSRTALVLAAALLLAGLGYIVYSQLPAIGAGALLHPARRVVTAAPPTNCLAMTIKGAGVELAGWRCSATGSRRGTIVYLHGVADNREGAIGAIDRFTRRGFNVIAYDSRAHGNSGGDECTFGYFEKEDLGLVLDAVANPPVVLIGVSLGAAVALQHAPRDSRVVGVVAADTFSDLRTVANERAPFLFSPRTVDEAFALAEERAHFQVDGVSPVRAAAEIKVPVLLIHGDADRDTPLAHSERVYDALRGAKRLIRVPGATHSQSLTSEMWVEIERFVESSIPLTD